MDRMQALDILDALPPDHAADAPEVQEAVRLLEADPEGRCQLEARRALMIRDSLDREIRRAMDDVVVPVGARQRLLEKLVAKPAQAANPAQAVKPAQTVRPGQPGDVASVETRSIDPRAEVPAVAPPARLPFENRTNPRRAAPRLWKSASVAALVLVLLAIAWQVRSPRVALEDVQQAADPVTPSELPLFAGSYLPSLPDGWQGRITFDASQDGAPEFRQITVGPRSTPVAICGFRAWSRGRGAEGYLLVLPARRLINPPPETSFATAPDVYSGALAMRSWTAGDQVFVCVTRGGEAGLHLLKRLLDVGMMA